MGYSETSKAYRIWIPSKNKIEVTRDVKILNKMYFDNFDENNHIYDFLVKTLNEPVIEVEMNNEMQVNINSENDNEEDECESKVNQFSSKNMN
jgi:hypothetical protein